jgi:acetyltransferase-like isoleucine patch superfamily enzyme
MRKRDPRQARFATLASLRWVLRHRAFTPYYLVRYWRFLRLRLRRDVVTEGFVFLGRGVELTARRGYGRIVLGRWVHVGDRCAIRAHEGTVRIGDKVVLGSDVRINGYLDIEMGAATLVADWVYVCDFDHVTTDLTRPIKDQGIVKTPVRIGSGCWLGTQTTVTRGVRIGTGAVLAANSVATRDIPAYAIAGGVPARVIRSRRPDDELRVPDYLPLALPDAEPEQ